MTGQNSQREGEPAELRERAEVKAREKVERQPESLDALSPEDAVRMVHELRVHQIELEMQNEELRRAQAELDASRARYFDLYDLAPVGYCTLTEQGLILEANLTASSLLGVGRDVLVDQPFTRFIVDQDQDAYYLHRRRLFETREPQVCELRLLPAGSPPFWAQLQATIVTGADGIRACRVTISNITDRKHAEEEREKLLAQLYQAQKMEAIGTLAGGIAHDFNNILGGILGGLSLMEIELDRKAEVQADIREMKALVQRGAELARQLLGFARRGKYDVRPLDLKRAAIRISAMFGSTHRNIAVRLDFAPDLLRVLMDGTQLEQVLLNLLLNAGQAMPEGGRIVVSAENTVLAREETESQGASPGRFVKLVVADTGIGMDPAARSRLFEPFFTTKAQGQGTGLGLASVYGIVKGHKGLIRVESEIGKGTTFTIYLPATELPAAIETIPAAPIHRGTGTILVVDDEQALLNICARYLERMGYQVLTAGGGEQAIELLRERGEEISLVILDLTMPEMSGARAFDAIRELLPGMKVLLSSGYSIDGQAQELLARGCNGFIQKPFDAAALSVKLQELLGEAARLSEE